MPTRSPSMASLVEATERDRQISPCSRLCIADISFMLYVQRCSYTLVGLLHIGEAAPGEHPFAFIGTPLISECAPGATH